MRHVELGEHLLFTLRNEPTEQNSESAEEKLAPLRMHPRLPSNHVPASQLHMYIYAYVYVCV